MSQETGFDFGATAPASASVTSTQDVDSLVFDLSGVEEDKKFEIIPKGTYDAVVDELEFGASKAGNPMITVKYMIVSSEYENRVIYDYWVLSGNGSEFGQAKLKKFLVRVCPDIGITNFKPKDFADSGAAVGRQCAIVLGIQTQKQGEYKGEKRNTIKDTLAPVASSFL